MVRVAPLNNPDSGGGYILRGEGKVRESEGCSCSSGRSLGVGVGVGSGVRVALRIRISYSSLLGNRECSGCGWEGEGF